MSRGALCFALCLVLSCAGRCGTARGDHEDRREDDDPIPLDPAEGRDAEALGPPRCKERQPIAAAVSLVGNAVPRANELLVSVVSTAPALAVLALPSGTLTSLRDAPGDAPPAVLAGQDARIVAAFFGPSSKKEQSVEVQELGGAPLFRLSRALDESLAIDLALVRGAAHVVWHEGGELVVRSAEQRVLLPAPAHAVLESPRLITLGDKLVALAIARVWDAADASHGNAPQTTWEGAGEPRSTSQLVGYLVDPSQASVAVSLTPARGHVDAFDVTAQHDALVVFAHDAAQTDARGGGTLSRIRWNGAGDPVRSSFRAGDVGNGPLALLGGTVGNLAYGAANGDSVLVRLGPDLSEGVASREPALDDARLIFRLGDRFLLAGNGELAWLACDEGHP